RPGSERASMPTITNPDCGVGRGRQILPAGDAVVERAVVTQKPHRAVAPRERSAGIWRQGIWLSLGSFAQSVLSVAQSLLVSRFYGPGRVMDALGACNGIIRYVTDVLGGIQRGFLQNYVLLDKERSRAEKLFWACQVSFFTLLALATIGTWLFREP